MARGKTENESEYRARRLAQEEAAAASATDPRARRSHREMAQRLRDSSDGSGDPLAQPIPVFVVSSKA